MKRIIYLLLLVTTLGFSSCLKLDDINAENAAQNATVTTANLAAQLAADDATIAAYLTANKLTATKDTSGLYYNIITPGTGSVIPSGASNITITYTGTLLNTGAIFDQAQKAVSYQLSSLITGLQIGVPFIRAGGQIILYVPSGLAYGTASPSASVPANSILIYNINLISVQ